MTDERVKIEENIRQLEQMKASAPNKLRGKGIAVSWKAPAMPPNAGSSAWMEMNEDPWERLRSLKEHVKKTPLQMLLRGQNLVGYKHYPDDIVKKPPAPFRAKRAAPQRLRS